LATSQRNGDIINISRDMAVMGYGYGDYDDMCKHEGKGLPLMGTYGARKHGLMTDGELCLRMPAV
jgi:hypothetical protein